MAKIQRPNSEIRKEIERMLISMDRLEQATNDLLKFLNSTTEKIPSYRQILFAIDERKSTNIEGLFKSEITKMFSQQEFSPIFKTLLCQGFSWINFHCAGIYKGDIIITVELPSNISQVPASNVSINLSGPAWKPESVVISNNSLSGLPEWDFERFYLIAENN